MMREMLELKAQLSGQQAPQAAAAPPVEAPAPQPAAVPEPAPVVIPAPQPEPEVKAEPAPAPQPEPAPAEDPLAAEKAALEAQKAETERMMREMMELKAKLDAQINKTKDGSEGAE